jgi:hypothetical protein
LNSEGKGKLLKQRRKKVSMKKAQGLPINIVVMLIIGLLIFSLGMALFFQIFEDSEAQIGDLGDQVNREITGLQCPRDQSLCSPDQEMKNGETETFNLFIANNLDTNEAFRVEIDLVEIDTGKFGIENSNGAILIQYFTGEVSVLSGTSASIPFSVQATRVGKTPANFITTAHLLDSSGTEIGKTPLAIRIE